MQMENELFGQPVTTRTDDPDLGKVAAILNDVNAEQLKLYKRMAPWWRSGWGAGCGLFTVTWVLMIWASLFGWTKGPLASIAAVVFLILATLFGMMHVAETIDKKRGTRGD